MFPRIVVSALCVVALLSSGGCGYRFGPSAGEAQTVVVRLFGNETREPLLERDLTNVLISELERSPYFVPLEPGDESQLSLEGTVDQYGSTAVAYDQDDTIVRYLVRVSATVVLREEPSGRIVWKGGTSASEEFSADPDKTVQLQLENLAKLRAISRLGEEITHSLSQRF